MTATPGPSHAAAAPRPVLPLALTAMGVVFGDIGTSPLYALRECFSGPHGIEPTPANILGVLSLVFWALILVISVKYVLFVMRADNRGEGGILALMALVRPAGLRTGARSAVVVTLGLFGAALLYGDGAITPAISVLSAVEGLRLAAPGLTPYVVPIAIAVLVALFLLQSRGTARIGALFGPVMALWFATLAVLGAVAVARAPEVLAAASPLHGLAFFARNGGHGFLVLGTVVLAVTGGEALYADMGHFGFRPIRLVWFVVALPALLLNYFGQGARLLGDPGDAEHAFFHLAPEWGQLPLVVLATAATVIASQAVISGAFSLTRQAVQLGFAPRVAIEHTSAHAIGQIYVPVVNWALMIATITLVVAFGESSRLAAAYGIAVTGTMVITTVLAFFVARDRWGWPLAVALAVSGSLLAIDLAFFSANMVKVADGGWVPLAIGAAVYVLMSTWKRGRELLQRRLVEVTVPFERLLDEIRQRSPYVVQRPGVYMLTSRDGTPPALVRNLRHNDVLHAPAVFLTIVTEEMPSVPDAERLTIERPAPGFVRVLAHYGFMEIPSVPEVIGRLNTAGIELPPDEVTYFLGREIVVATALPGMALWRERLFALMSRNAARAIDFYQIPSWRVFEVGTQIDL